MEIQTGSVVLTGRDIRCGDLLTVQHIRVESSAVHLTVPIGSGACAAQLSITLTIAETELNRVLAAQADQGLRDPRVALMHGSLRVTGRYEVMGPLAVPFAMVAVPRVEGGERIQLDVKDISVVGAALPGFSAQMLGERINAKLAETLNVRRLGLPVHLTSVAVETGRLNLSADAAIEWRPGETTIVRV